MAHPARQLGALSAALLLCGTALAEQAPADRWSVTAHGSYRVVGWNQSNLELGADGTGSAVEKLGQTTFFAHRLRLGGEAKVRHLTFELEFDALDGLLNAQGGQVMRPVPAPEGGGAPPRLADPIRNQSYGLTLNSFALRKLSVQWLSKVGVFGLGAMPSNFGLGMLANGGDAPLDASLGDQEFGDRVVRAFYATQPLRAFGIHEHLDLAIGADLVLQDALGTLVRPSYEWANDGVWADKGVEGLIYLRHERGNYSSELYVTRRTEWVPDGAGLDPDVTAAFTSGLNVWAFDAAVRYHHPLGDPKAQRELFGAAEAAYVTGTTNEVRNLACPGSSSANECGVSQGGGVFEGGYRSRKVTAQLTLGYASGDGNPFDGTQTGFHFNRDFKAGLILFDQVLGWQSAAAVRRISDPNMVNVPPAGIGLYSTDGAITDAFFVEPSVHYRPLEHLELVGNVLWAVAPQPYVDPYWMTRTSATTNAFGMAAGRDYGVELDLGVNWRLPLPHGLTWLVGAAGGYFLPGDAFVVSKGSTMPDVYLVKARTALEF